MAARPATSIYAKFMACNRQKIWVSKLRTAGVRSTAGVGWRLVCVSKLSKFSIWFMQVPGVHLIIKSGIRRDKIDQKREFGMQLLFICIRTVNSILSYLSKSLISWRSLEEQALISESEWRSRRMEIQTNGDPDE